MTSELHPACIICGAYADMDSPADLCEAHWQNWFDYDPGWACVTGQFSSRTCERGGRGCTTKHDHAARPDDPSGWMPR